MLAKAKISKYLKNNQNLHLKIENSSFARAIIGMPANQEIVRKAIIKKLHEYQSNIVILCSCKTCKFNIIVPIITPIVFFQILNLNHENHPFFSNQQHIGLRSHHSYTTKIINECQNRAETLRITEIKCKSYHLPVPKIAQGINNARVAKFFGNSAP